MSTSFCTNGNRAAFEFAISDVRTNITIAINTCVLLWGHANNKFEVTHWNDAVSYFVERKTLEIRRLPKFMLCALDGAGTSIKAYMLFTHMSR
jgi:hypothetical protein